MNSNKNDIIKTTIEGSHKCISRLGDHSVSKIKNDKEMHKVEMSKHRKLRKLTTTEKAAIGLLGGIALTAGSTAVADAQDWDRLASCESSNRRIS